MKQNILKFYISILLCVISFSAIAQTKLVTDTIPKKKYYNLRIGVDISKPITSIINPDIVGYEITADMQLTKKIYAAVELGIYDRTTQEDYINFNSKGSYLKLGGNYNLYTNYGKMRNEIFCGFRYGLSAFTQTLNNYTPNYYGTYFDADNYTVNEKHDGLSAHWIEIVVGLKTEVLKNLYLGMSIAIKTMIYQKQPDNFLNLYIPGFERVYENNTGFSFNYTISYQFPLTKKDTKIINIGEGALINP